MEDKNIYQTNNNDDAITSFEDEYFFLSNFYPCNISIDGIEYPTAEHAFQALKTFDSEERNRVREAPSPYLAKRYGRMVTLQENWNTERFNVMERVIRVKFQDQELAQKLISTGNRKLIEGNHWRDTTWGCITDKNGELKGKNHLGFILMKVREELILQDKNMRECFEAMGRDPDINNVDDMLPAARDIIFRD